jgi:putative hydrolase of the HAD superfamily
MIDTVFLDAGNTLLKAHPSVAALYAGTAARYGSDPPLDDLMIHFKAVRAEMLPMVTGSGVSEDGRNGSAAEKAWWKTFVYRLFQRVGMVNDFDAFFEELYDVFSREDSWRLYPEVIDVLETLRGRSLRLFMVSNWDSRLLNICENLGLTPFFEEIIISSIVGVEKPDPGIYRIALGHAGIEPQRALHVGDDREMDFLAAREVGLNALLLDRDGRYGPQPFRITSLKDVLTYLESDGQ